MIHFYIFYSMFGFQRTGDLAWAFGDARGRGFLLGATAVRTTLNGEGLQHEDGHSHLLASTIPCIRAYDPAFAYEVATIVKDGMQRMAMKGEDVYYYLTLYNQDYSMPPMPTGVEEGILRACTVPRRRAAGQAPRAIVRERRAAHQRPRAGDPGGGHDVAADVKVIVTACATRRCRSSAEPTPRRRAARAVRHPDDGVGAARSWR
jgi:pyruvate dehydrogenase E1 component